MTTHQDNRVKDSKTVFALRKEGRLGEALEIGRSLHKAQPGDAWVTRALGWTLVDLAKAAVRDGDQEAAAGFCRELGGLSLGEGDELLEKSRARLLASCQPGGRIIAEARAAKVQENHPLALKLYREAVSKFPGSEEAQTGLGWELFRALNSALKQEEPPVQQVSNLLQEYAGLNLVEKPGLLHSLMLAAACRVGGDMPRFTGFVYWWDVGTLRDEDWMPQKGTGDAVYPPLAVKLASALNKALKAGEHQADLSWIEPFMKRVVERFPDEEWLPYYYGKLLVQMGRLDEARQFVMPVIRNKRRDFWAWDVLASTCGRGEADLRKACLCKALLCGHKDEAFLVNVRLELARTMIAVRDYPEAKHEITRYAAIRQQKNWRIPEDVQELMNENWFATTEPSEGNREYYSDHAPVAEALAFEGIPWAEGVVSGRIAPEQGLKPAVFVMIKGPGNSRDLRVNPKGFPALVNAPIGAPVAVRVITAEDRPVVVDVRLREGQPWDLLPEVPGVVSHVNHEKSLASITTGVDAFVVAHFNNFKEAAALAEGDPVIVRFLPAREEHHERLVALRKVQECPHVPFLKSYSGLLNKPAEREFGFVGDIFIPPPLIQRGLADGNSISGVAVIETNRKTLKKGWKALTATANP